MLSAGASAEHFDVSVECAMADGPPSPGDAGCYRCQKLLFEIGRDNFGAFLMIANAFNVIMLAIEALNLNKEDRKLQR